MSSPSHCNVVEVVRGSVEQDALVLYIERKPERSGYNGCGRFCAGASGVLEDAKLRPLRGCQSLHVDGGGARARIVMLLLYKVLLANAFSGKIFKEKGVCFLFRDVTNERA